MNRHIPAFVKKEKLVLIKMRMIISGVMVISEYNYISSVAAGLRLTHLGSDKETVRANNSSSPLNTVDCCRKNQYSSFIQLHGEQVAQ